MTDAVTDRPAAAPDGPDAETEATRLGGMTAQEAAYMRGHKEPVAGSVPMSTSRFLNSPLYVHAWSVMSLRRVGSDLPYAYDTPAMSTALRDVTDYGRAVELIAEERLKYPAFAQWLDRRQSVDFTAEELAGCAPGTLGAEIRDFLEQSGMTLAFSRNYEVKSDFDYLMQMNAHTHDLQHIVSGFRNNILGEHAITIMTTTCNAVHFSPEMAGFVSAPSEFFGMAAFNRALLHYREAVPLYMEATRLAIEAGQAIKVPLLMIDFRQYLDWQMEDVRADLGFKGGPGKAWDYADAFAIG